MRLLCFGHTVFSMGFEHASRCCCCLCESKPIGLFQVSEQNNKRGDAPSFPSPTCLGDTSTGALPSSMEWRAFPTRQVVSQKGFVHLARFVEGQWFQVGLTGSECALTFLKHVPPSTPLLCCFNFASFLWLHLTRKLLTPRNSCGESWSGPSGATPRPLSRTRRRTILWRLKPSVGSALPNVKPPKPGMGVSGLGPKPRVCWFSFWNRCALKPEIGVQA